MSSRRYGLLMVLAVVVVWRPFALGGYPVGANSLVGRSRTVLHPVAAGGLLVGLSFYAFGSVLANGRSYIAFRLTDPVDAGAVNAGHVQVTGEVAPVDDALEPGRCCTAEKILYRPASDCTRSARRR